MCCVVPEVTTERENIKNCHSRFKTETSSSLQTKLRNLSFSEIIQMMKDEQVKMSQYCEDDHNNIVTILSRLYQSNNKQL